MQAILGAALATIATVAFAFASSATVEDFLAAVGDSRIVILGEIHDNPEHHFNQARIVEALQPDAIVFEMIPQDSEGAVNNMRDEGATAAAIAEALDWEESGWPPFEFYAQIMEAAPNARIFGAGQPTADLNRAMVEGAAGPFGPDAAIYGLDQPLSPEEQAIREELMATAHCDLLPQEALPGMVEAQRFRDAGLADATLWARTMTGGGRVVVIAGNGHADLVRGMPEALRVADPAAEVISLGQLEAPPDEAAADAFDFVLVSAPAARGDPCLSVLD